MLKLSNAEKPQSYKVSIASFALRMSMQRRMSPSCLETTTTGLTHGVNPFAGSIMSKIISSWIFSSTLDLRLKGVLDICYATGLTFRPMWSFTARSFTFPTSLKTCGYFSCRTSAMVCELVLQRQCLSQFSTQQGLLCPSLGVSLLCHSSRRTRH